MKLEELLTLRVDVSGPLIEVGAGPQGGRLVANASGGTFDGPRLRGRVLPSGGDWLLVDQKNGWHIDVRLLLETEDEARIYLRYTGLLVMNERTAEAVAQERTTAFGDTYWMIQPSFETGDARYDWLNQILAVGEGRLASGGVEYRIYGLVNG